MGYYNMIYQYGDNNFINICKKVGVDGLIVVDLPYPENKEFAKKCKKKGISFYSISISYYISKQNEKDYKRFS